MNQTQTESHAHSGQPLAWWTGIPLYVRIMGGLAVGVCVGLVLKATPDVLGIPSEKILLSLGAITGLILKLLGALAPPLILVAVLDTLIKARLQGGVARHMIFLLIINTVVAILVASICVEI